MAVISEQTYTADGSQKNFQVVGTILSDSHVGVWILDNTLEVPVESRIPTADYDVLGSFVLFNDAPVSGNAVRLVLTDNGEGIDSPPGDTTIVAENIEKVVIVADNITEVIAVSDNIDEIAIVGSDPVKSAVTAINEEPLKQSILDAEDNADNAEQAWEDFQSRYYGSYANNPTLDPLGNLPTDGDLYFNTSLERTMIYSGTVWGEFGSAVNGFASNDEAIATEGQTLFTGLSYDIGFTMVFRNGYKIPTSGFTANDGTTLTLTTPAVLNDDILIISFGAFTSGGFDSLTEAIIQNTTDIGLNEDRIVVLENGAIITNANLDNNTIDIETNRVDILGKVNTDGTTSQEKILLADKTGSEPTYELGNVYYANGGLNVQTEHPEVTLQVGQELHIEVINNSGATILNGKACRIDGTVGDMPQIELAIADNFTNATVLGFATHDMIDGEVGLVSVFGLVRDIDTSMFSNGNPLYLSDTVAGDFTETAPIVRTQLGNVANVDDTTGSIFANILSNIPLPRTLGSLLDASAPTSLPADLVNGTPITAYSSKIEIVTEVNTIIGVITIQDTGTYRLNISLHSFFDGVGGAGKKEFDVDLVDITSSNTVKTIKGFILKDAETYDITDNGAVSLIAGHEYRLELRSEIALTNFAFSSSTFYIESILY